ncbi:unnamed protein product [Camellia sinensis]
MGNNHYASRELVQEALEQPRLRFVPHIGYVCLFPFVAKIIPLVSCMKDLITKQCFLNLFVLLFSVSYLYTVVVEIFSMYMKYNTEHDAPYWRGPIWMNINYMILSSLHHYSKENGPYRDKAKIIYNDLRSNLISVVKNYQQIRYFWEQFDQKKSKGKGARVFPGWTSLVLLIMVEAYSECSELGTQFCNFLRKL